MRTSVIFVGQALFGFAVITVGRLYYSAIHSRTVFSFVYVEYTTDGIVDSNSRRVSLWRSGSRPWQKGTRLRRHRSR